MTKGAVPPAKTPPATVQTEPSAVPGGVAAASVGAVVSVSGAAATLTWKVAVTDCPKASPR